MLVWDAVTVEIDGYKLYVGPDEEGPWTEIATIPADTTTYTHQAISSCYYGIKAYNGEESSENYAVVYFSEGGYIPDVTGFEIDDASSGTTVILVWNAVTSNSPEAIDGYRLYMREFVGSGTWYEIALIPASATTYTHAATLAGEYGIVAIDGDDVSANVAVCNDMPNFISSSYTIWNNHAPAPEHNGFIFGATSGQTCIAGLGGHDVYCFDGGWGSYTWLYAGDYGPFGGGYDTDFYEHASGYSMPGAGPWEPAAGPMVVGDVIFAELYDGYWVKIYVTALPHYEGGTDNAYGITFYYDWQPINGLELFTTDSQP